MTSTTVATDTSKSARNPFENNSTAAISPPDTIGFLPSTQSGGPPGVDQDSIRVHEDSVLDAAELARIRRSLRPGKTGFNIPDTMEVAHAYSVELILAPPTLSDSALRAAVHGLGRREVDSVRVARRMVAELSGDGFVITPQGPTPRLTGVTDEVQWQWYVVPVETGENIRTLHLTLSAIVKYEGSPDTVPVKVLDRSIIVHISWVKHAWTVIKENWDLFVGTPIATVLLTGLGQLVAKRRRRRPPPKRPNPRTPT